MPLAEVRELPLDPRRPHESGVVGTFIKELCEQGPCDHDPSSSLWHVCEHWQGTGELRYFVDGEPVSQEQYQAATA